MRAGLVRHHAVECEQDADDGPVPFQHIAVARHVVGQRLGAVTVEPGPPIGFGAIGETDL